jgi:hypothetical protein
MIKMIQAEMKENMYQTTKLAEDGITQIVDTSVVHTSHEVNIHALYFIDDRLEALKTLKADLEELCKEVDEAIEEEYEDSLNLKR